MPARRLHSGAGRPGAGERRGTVRLVDAVGLAETLGAAGGLATRQQLLSAGMSPSAVHRAAASGRLVRVRPRVYARGPLPPLPRRLVVDDRAAAELLVHVRAVLLSLGPGAAADGRTAAAVRGWGLLVEPRLVEVVVRHGRGRVRLQGVRARQCRGVDVELSPLGVAVVAAPDTVLRCCARLPLLEAVVLVDSARRSREVDLPQLHAAARGRAGRAGGPFVQRVLALADPSCGSVLESVLRVRLRAAGVTGFRTQVVVLRRRRYVLRTDFCFERARLVVEADGDRWHPDGERDRRTDNQLAAAGWRVLRYGWAEVVHDAARVVAEVVEALHAGSWTPSVEG